MWRVRPAKLDDLQQILDIAGAQTARLSSTLPKTEETLARKIQHAQASLADNAPEGTPRRFLFVLENTDTGEIAGTAGIDSRAGNGGSSGPPCRVVWRRHPAQPRDSDPEYTAWLVEP